MSSKTAGHSGTEHTYHPELVDRFIAIVDAVETGTWIPYIHKTWDEIALAVDRHQPAAVEIAVINPHEEIRRHWTRNGAIETRRQDPDILHDKDPKKLTARRKSRYIRLDEKLIGLQEPTMEEGASAPIRVARFRPKGIHL